jgi:hypothetical protein
MPHGQCLFNRAWLDKDCYRGWLVQDKLKPASNARCSLCLKTFDVSNMGEAALKSHMTSKKHKQLSQPRNPSCLVRVETHLLPQTAKEVDKVADGSNSDTTAVHCSGHAEMVIMKAAKPVPASLAVKNDVLSAEESQTSERH